MPDYSFHSFNVEDMAMRYSDFAPRFFNYCLSIGMQPNKIMPSRAFCSDENQGYPIILIAKHFGTFPFNHGRVGGIVATNRHSPHADHGKDVVIIQASHVGYNPENNEFGVYRRLQSQNQEMSTDCGAICGVLDWYKSEYAFAKQQILLGRHEGKAVVVIDNQLLREAREEGIFLNLDKMIANNKVLHSYSVSKSFAASQELIDRIGRDWPDKNSPIGDNLFPEFIWFKRSTNNVVASDLLNRNLIKNMPLIITSKWPALTAAQVNSQMEFDRTFRTIIKEETYRKKKIVFISGIHIDISPREEQLFPLTKFVPWAAYIQNEEGESYTLEQRELYDVLMSQSTVNQYKIDLTAAIHEMEDEPGIKLHVGD